MMKDKNRKLFHKLMDLALEKEPESGVEVNVSSLDCTSRVWIFKMKGGKPDGVKAHYTTISGDDSWYKWQGGLPERVSVEEVLEALRNA
jgi:hypothetical protein